MNLRIIPIEDLRCDPSASGGYQRPVSDSRIARMAKKFDADLAGAICVNIRPNGEKYVWDGQHRLAAAKRSGQTSMLCLVESFGGQQEEARRFLETQGHGRKNLSAMDIFWARFSVGDKEALEINEIVEMAGLRISRGSRGGSSGDNRSVSAINAIQKVYRDCGSGILFDALSTLYLAWPSDSTILGGVAIGSVAVALSFRPEIDRERLSSKLSAILPKNLTTTLRNLAGTGACQSSVSSANAVIDIYNKGKKTGRVAMISVGEKPKNRMKKE